MNKRHSMSRPRGSLDEKLRADVRLLGDLLGETIKSRHGADLYELVEQVRSMAKQIRVGKHLYTQKLIDLLSSLDSKQLFNLARSFTFFLNLANIAEQHHQIRQRKQLASQQFSSTTGQLGDFIYADIQGLLEQGREKEDIYRTITKLHIELVLTAHPTEVVRRSVSSKFLRIARLLEEQDKSDLSNFKQAEIIISLKRAIKEVWETDEIRRIRPTPVDEAKTGLVAIEHSFWQTIPSIHRELDFTLNKLFGKPLPLNATPITLGSWMGGDRDGNPNTTPKVTQLVCIQAKQKAAELFFNEIDDLRRDLSMIRCSDALRAEVGEATHEPYRALLERVLKKLKATLKHYIKLFELAQAGRSIDPSLTNNKIFTSKEQIMQPLMLCYESLIDCGDQIIAQGRLTDIIRRLNIFGLTMSKLDIRQEAIRHSEAMACITRYLGMGSYLEWDEATRQAFLYKELKSTRPLITSSFPQEGQANSEVREVLATFRMIAKESSESFGAYVISMAKYPSDILVVALLQKECRVAQPLRVVPLFERLDDLNGAPKCMTELLKNEWYRHYIRGRHEVMIGYSDSAKDAGILSASWGLYQAQEKLVDVFQAYNIELTLFHGRGGTVARGGGPAYKAIRSQPPGSVNGTMRVTEQGEVIQAKFGLPGMATETMRIYIGAVLEATLAPPPKPKPLWREQMNQLSDDAVTQFRHVVQENVDFVPYFQSATPQQEIGKLKIGSRPASRRKGGGIKHLRAIPWIFAWTQNRLLLPGWLGIGHALNQAITDDRRALLVEMEQNWPFFKTTMNSIEMVFSKTSPELSSLYDARLVPDELQSLGNDLLKIYHSSKAFLLDITEHSIPMQNEDVVKQSVDVRNTYVVPLNLLQIELLARARSMEIADSQVLDALLITINGIAAGMRNTG